MIFLVWPSGSHSRLPYYLEFSSPENTKQIPFLEAKEDRLTRSSSAAPKQQMPELIISVAKTIFSLSNHDTIGKMRRLLVHHDIDDVIWQRPC